MGAIGYIFWISLALVAYAYAAFPVVIYIASRLFGRLEQRPVVDDAQLPQVTLLIAAYNEASVIAQRVRNALAMDYPADRMQVVIASDGSSDGTPDIVRQFAADPRVRLLDYKQRRGKSSVLNAAVGEIESGLVMLSDANTDFDLAAPRNLAAWFSDPTVGVVCGRLVLTDPATGKNADGMYWKYETFLKKCEARLGALLGSNGAIYAIRRELYVPIAPSTIVDDFVIPLLAKLKHGCRIVYDADAFAVEESAADVKAEFRRRSRIGAGGWQAITMLWRLMSPRWGWTAFAFVSHKVLRWLCPFFLLAMLVTCVVRLHEPLYRWLLIGQIAFYATSWLVSLLPTTVKLIRPLRLTTMFTSMNLALLVGFWRWFRGTQKSAWERTARLVDAHKQAA